MNRVEWKKLCPYGVWQCADGRQVLFNRMYWPILERYPGQPASAARPGEWVPWKGRHHFFNDSNSPWGRPRQTAARKTLAAINGVLAEWGLPPLPRLPTASGPFEKGGAWTGTGSWVPTARVNPWATLLSA
jgi:hypothetical protein